MGDLAKVQTQHPAAPSHTRAGGQEHATLLSEHIAPLTGSRSFNAGSRPSGAASGMATASGHGFARLPVQPAPAAGEVLNTDASHFLNRTFAQPFDDVRIHRGAGDLPQTAIAAARGSQLSLDPGLHRAPRLLQRMVLAHEAAHVLQHRQARLTSAPSWDEPRLEAEARLASVAAVQGRTYTIKGIDREDRPRFHPIFISTHGDQGFLNIARDYYIRWGYGTPVSVGSIEEVVTQLAGGGGHVDRMTIVSHAVPDNINISFLRGGPGFVHESEWAITTRQALPEYSGHATEASMVEQVIRDVRTASAENAALLQRLNLDFIEPEERQFVWWLADANFVHRVQPANAIPNRPQVRQRARQNAGYYRDRLRERYQYFAQFDPSADPNDINRLEQAINAVLATYQWGQIDVQTGRAISEQIRSGREAAVQRVLSQPYGLGVTEPFGLALMFAQFRFDSSSTIEIKGCRIGQNRAYLEGISRFFGGGQSNPTVTAPDLFQIFGWMGTSPHPNQTNHLRGLWNNGPIRRAFIYWAGVFGWPLSDPPVADDLVNTLRAGHAFPVGFNLHYLVGRDPGNVAAWFARFGYRLTQAPDIEQTFFAGRATTAGVGFTLIDWLQDRRPGAGRPAQIIFPPDPEYQNHIISAQAAGAAPVAP